MSSDQLNLPYALVDYVGAIEVLICYDDVCIKRRQAPTPIVLPETPVKPLVKLQCLNQGHKLFGPIYAYDYDREEFITYDERIHTIPKSSAPVDVGASSSQLNLSASAEVVVETKVAPPLESPPLEDVDEELDGLSCIVVDGKDEDEE
jgi:hypothetical protein